jgi:hypothetical protein
VVVLCAITDGRQGSLLPPIIKLSYSSVQRRALDDFLSALPLVDLVYLRRSYLQQISPCYKIRLGVLMLLVRK